MAMTSFAAMGDDRIEFIVRYLNGSEARLRISRSDLRQGTTLRG
jgi:hypothetical protein